MTDIEKANTIISVLRTEAMVIREENVEAYITLQQAIHELEIDSLVRLYDAIMNSWSVKVVKP